ncbi:SRPBCC family protein [Actinosynnema sp.]|uniref:SRPBCC family protein n=1 Tax=Actinosynnema sp. TaxID=1872144 RepID=UPI003F8425DE
MRDARLETIDGKPVLRLERRFAHPVSKVWRAVSEPAELAHWFPAEVELENGRMRFAFPDPAMDAGEGRVLELDPPRVFAFEWNEDVLRFELLPEPGGCLLVLTQVIGAGPLGAGRNAVGWRTCLEALDARLGDRPFTAPADLLGPIERHVREFGLDRGEVADGRIRFSRDLVWRPLAEVWAVLTGGATPAVGDTAPESAGCSRVRPGPVVVVEEPTLLEFDSSSGRVRWELSSDPVGGTVVTLTHVVGDGEVSVPAALAAWHVRLDLLFAALLGEERPWPGEGENGLAADYAVIHN